MAIRRSAILVPLLLLSIARPASASFPGGYPYEAYLGRATPWTEGSPGYQFRVLCRLDATQMYPTGQKYGIATSCEKKLHTRTWMGTYWSEYTTPKTFSTTIVNTIWSQQSGAAPQVTQNCMGATRCPAQVGSFTEYLSPGSLYHAQIYPGASISAQHRVTLPTGDVAPNGESLAYGTPTWSWPFGAGVCAESDPGTLNACYRHGGQGSETWVVKTHYYHYLD